jgi:tetratricopeptide (TPR) repeat protein
MRRAPGRCLAFAFVPNVPAFAAIPVLLAALLGEPDALEQEGLRALQEQRYQEALTAFEKLLAQSAQRSSAHYGKGMALSGLRDYAGAVEALERAVSLDASHAAAWRQLLVLYPRVGRADAALEAYRKARQLGPVASEDRLSLVRNLRIAGLVAQAREILEELPPETRTAADHLHLGLMALDEADYETAARHLREATRQSDRSPPQADYLYAQALEGLGQNDLAVLHYRRELEKQPRHRRARFRLGNLLLRSGRAEEGRVLLRGYEEFRQRERSVYTLSRVLYSGGLSGAEEREKALTLVNLLIEGSDVEQADRVLQQALSKYPDDPDFRTAQVSWLLASGEPQKARESLEPILSLPSPPKDALWLSARLHVLGGHGAQALEAFERLLSVDNSPSARVLTEFATAQAMTGRSKEAESSLRRALEQDPSLAEAHADLGLLLQAEGRVAEAEERLRRALAIDPGLVSAQRALAALLLRRGDAAGAEGLVRGFIRLNPKDPGLRRDLAAALAALGLSEEAETQRKAAVELEAGGRP